MTTTPKVRLTKTQQGYAYNGLEIIKAGQMGANHVRTANRKWLVIDADGRIVSKHCDLSRVREWLAAQ